MHVARSDSLLPGDGPEWSRAPLYSSVWNCPVRSAHILRVDGIGNWHLLLQTNQATCILPLTDGVRVFVCENLALYGGYARETMSPK